MVFTSPRFWLFMGLVLLGLAMVRPLEWRKHFLAVASCFFYAAWDWRYLGLLLLISVIDYIAADHIGRASSKSRQRAWLLLSVSSNLGVLAYFKYCNFFIDNANGVLALFGFSLPALHVLLPVGISFYTFKTMSYVIDVYRGTLAPCRSWLNYVTFITFFPELIAGPIVRASIFLPQLTREIGPTRARLRNGLSAFLVGLVKKFLIADRMALVADPIFASPQTFSSGTIWLGVLAYTIQIYCDFSGYSDMAIGCAKMIGYDLPENFNMPYLSRSITEFWQRWHMTLSAWLKDYLYIPLGGNRHGALMTYRNLMLTMLLGGLWHGASWNFVVWGGLHGLGLAVHKFWVSSRRPKRLLPEAISVAGTFLFVVCTWVPFRSKSFADTTCILKKMAFCGLPGGARWVPEAVFWCGAVVLIGHWCGYKIAQMRRDHGYAQMSFFAKCLSLLGFETTDMSISGPYVVPQRITVGGVYLVSVICLAIFFFAPMNTNPFIYFQF